MKAFLRGWFALLFLGLAGCTAVPADLVTAFLAPGVQYRPPNPAELGRSVSMVQMITVRYRGETFTFEAYLSVTPDALTLVTTDPLGRRAMTLTFRDWGRLTAEVAPWVPDFIRPENILADITLTYWPEAAVRAGLATSGTALAAAPRRRVIAQDGRDIISIDYDTAPAAGWPGFARLRNLAFGYDLDLRSAASE